MSKVHELEERTENNNISVINDKQNYLVEETNKKNNASDLSMCYSDFSQRSNLSITTKFH